MKSQYKKTIRSLRALLVEAKNDEMDDESNVWRSVMIDADDEIQIAGTIDYLKDKDIKRHYHSSVGVLAEMMGAAEADGKDEDGSPWIKIMETAQEVLDAFDGIKRPQAEMSRPRA